MTAKAMGLTQQPQFLEDDRPASVAKEDSAGGGALFQRLFGSGDVTPDSVAAVLQRCPSERLCHAILAEIGARWGNTGVQQALAAMAHHAGPDAVLGTGAHVGVGTGAHPQEHVNDATDDRSSHVASSADANHGSEVAQAGSANLGPANLGSTNLGPANLGPANLGPANLGPANLRPANLGPANLGPASLGPANLGPANLGPLEPTLSPRAEYERGARRGEVALDYLTQIESAFMPGFRRAVDALDDAAAREFGILMLGGLRKIEGVERELQQLASQAPVLASGPGDAPFDASSLPVEHARMLDMCELLAWRLPAVERLLVERVGPTLFRGDLIMSGQPALPIGPGALSVLETEAATTIALIATVKAVLEAVPDAQSGRCPILTEA
jgi:hypothetical protein